MARLNRVKAARKTKSGQRPTCGKCGITIEVGMPYLWWANRTTYSSMKRTRCVDHPPRPSEMTLSPHKSNAYATQEGLYDALDEASTIAEIASALREAAESARDELGEGLRESADNIVDGFGHETSQSEELNERADAADEWADAFDSASYEVEGLVENADDPEVDEDTLDEAREIARGAADECPE